MSVEASASFLASIVGFLPPFLPCVLAAYNPATAPKTWKANFPPGVVVFLGAKTSRSDDM